MKLKQAIGFHGHLGPYLVLGLLAGELALKKTGAKKHFGIEVKVWGAQQRPKSCLIDGLQLSTGATYGKGNIHKYKGSNISVVVSNTETGRTIKLSLKKDILKTLSDLKNRADSQRYARSLSRMGISRIFKVGL